MVQIDQDTLVTAIVVIVGYELLLGLIRWIRGRQSRTSAKVAVGAIRSIATPGNIGKVVDLAGGKVLLYTKYGWIAKALLWGLKRTGKIELANTAKPNLERFGKPVAERLEQMHYKTSPDVTEAAIKQWIKSTYEEKVKPNDDGNPITQNLQ